MHRSPRTAALALATGVLVAAATGCSKDSGSTEAFCAQVARVPALETVLDRFTEADPTVLADRIEQARAAYADLADAAPKQIEEETDQVVSLVDATLDAVEEHPTDPAKASAQLRKAVAAHEGVASDRAKVAAFAQDRCDVRLDATLTDGGAATSSTTTTTEPETVITAPSSSSTTTAPSTTGG